MTPALPLRFIRPLPNPAEALRSAFVVSCALALILAGPAVPLGL